MAKSGGILSTVDVNLVISVAIGHEPVMVQPP